MKCTIIEWYVVPFLKASPGHMFMQNCHTAETVKWILEAENAEALRESLEDNDWFVPETSRGMGYNHIIK